LGSRTAWPRLVVNIVEPVMGGGFSGISNWYIHTIAMSQDFNPAGFQKLHNIPNFGNIA
jgi:hypothetical protein